MKTFQKNSNKKKNFEHFKFPMLIKLNTFIITSRQQWFNVARAQTQAKHTIEHIDAERIAHKRRRLVNTHDHALQPAHHIEQLEQQPNRRSFAERQLDHDQANKRGRLGEFAESILDPGAFSSKRAGAPQHVLFADRDEHERRLHPLVQLELWEWRWSRSQEKQERAEQKNVGLHAQA